MALIPCPKCGETISEKAKNCIHCGYVINDETVNEQKCPECGAAITADMDVCLTCGCPIEKSPSDIPQKVEVTKVKIDVDKKKTKYITVAILAIVILAIIGVSVKALSGVMAKKEYAKKYDKAVSLMMSGASKAENVGSLIHDVWYNTIYKKDSATTNKYTKDSRGEFYDDFNMSLACLMISSTYTSDVDRIKTNQESVQLLMKDMKNPPKGYEDAYDELKKFYDAYTKLVNLAVDPTGSLTSYTSNFNAADTETANCYKACQLYLED